MGTLFWISLLHHSENWYYLLYKATESRVGLNTESRNIAGTMLKLFIEWFPSLAFQFCLNSIIMKLEETLWIVGLLNPLIFHPRTFSKPGKSSSLSLIIWAIHLASPSCINFWAGDLYIFTSVTNLQWKDIVKSKLEVIFRFVS